MNVTMYTRLGDRTLSISGRTPRNNPQRTDQRYISLLEKNELSLEKVQTFMHIEHVGRDILFSYMFSEKFGGWIFSANHGKTSVCYGPMTFEETQKETLEICKRMGVCA
jgi:hypothetical protein